MSKNQTGISSLLCGLILQNFFLLLKLGNRLFLLKRFFSMVGLTGLEPVTLRLSSACSNQLSYRPVAEKV